jgi:hypothetical protein
MKKVKPKLATEAPIAVIADGLFDLEEKVSRVRDLAYALRMMFESLDVPEGSRDALDYLAITILGKMDAIKNERTRLWHLAQTTRLVEA